MEVPCAECNFNKELCNLVSICFDVMYTFEKYRGHRVSCFQACSSKLS